MVVSLDGSHPKRCIFHYSHVPIPVAARSKAWICGQSLTRIVGSNTAGGMDVCVVLLYKDGSMERKVT
jgi:hypothetical protein